MTSTVNGMNGSVDGVLKDFLQTTSTRLPFTSPIEKRLLGWKKGEFKNEQDEVAIATIQSNLELFFCFIAIPLGIVDCRLESIIIIVNSNPFPIESPFERKIDRG